MKRLVYIFILVVFVSNFNFGESTINIMSPVSNDLWQPGTEYDITWNKSGQQHPKVKIRLYDSTGTQKLLGITDDTANDGLFKWMVPSGYTSGTYVIRVKTLDNLTTDDSGLFEIGVPTSEEQIIDVTEPVENKTWYRGKSYYIKWTKSGSMSGTVKITLHNQPETPPLKTISPGTSNSGSFHWDIPSTFTTGSYVVRVFTSDSQVGDYSKQFNIKQKKYQISPEMVPSPLHGNIEILKPSTSSFWKEGTTHLIKWKNKFTKKNTIKIDLYNYSGNTFVRTIKTILGVNVIKLYKGRGRPSETSTYNWFIPKGLGPAKYVIKISRTDGKASGKSGVFTIQIGTKVKTYEINPSVGNYCKRTFWAVGPGNLAHLKSQVGGCVGVVGEAQGWAGFWNYMPPHGKSYHGDIWRTHVTFNLSQFIGKGIILKAKLKFIKHDYPSGSNCAISVYKMLAPLGDAFSINGDLIGNTSNMTSIAQNWVGFPNGNFGIMFVGPDESFRHDQSKCRISLRGIKLEIEFLEKE